MMKTTWFWPLCAALCGIAQSSLADPAPVRVAPSRVESSLTVQAPLATGSTPDDQIQQSEALKKALYQTAARECAVLQEAFKSECRLQSVRAMSSIQSRSGAPDLVNVSGSFSYELLTRPN